MSESTASNLLNKTKNWQKATSWLFTKRGGVEFRTTEDKTRTQGSERDLILLHTHAKPNAMSIGSYIYFLVSCKFKQMEKVKKREKENEKKIPPISLFCAHFTRKWDYECPPGGICCVALRRMRVDI